MRSSALSLVSSVLLLAGCSGVEIPAGFGANDAPTVSLKVTDPEGRPIEGARVRVPTGQAQTTPLGIMSRSDPDGVAWVWFRDPARRLVEVHVDADDRAPVSLLMHVDMAPPTVVLGPGQRLEGSVADAEGRPFANVIVRARPRDEDNRRAAVWSEKTTQTDAEGRFALAGLPDEGALIDVDFPLTALFMTDVAGEQLAQPLQVRLEEGRPLTITVTDEGGEPLGQARVLVEVTTDKGSAQLAPTSTDESGSLTIQLPETARSLKVTADADDQPATTRLVNEGELAGPVVIALAPSRKLTGEVTVGGAPASGRVSVGGLTVPVTEGKFVVEGASMPVETETLVHYRWSASEHSSADVGPLVSEPVTLAEDEPTHVELEAPDAYPVTVTVRTADGPARGVVLMFHPVDEEGQALEDVPSSQTQPFASGVTNDEGTLRVLLLEGFYKVDARFGGTNALLPVDGGVYRPVDGDNLAMDFEMPVAATLAGTLVDEGDRPLGHRRFTVTSEAFNDVAITNADGTFALKGVPAGTVATLRVDGPSGEADGFSARLKAGESRTIRPGESMDDPATGDVPGDPLVGSDLPDPDAGVPDLGEADPGMPDGEPTDGEPTDAEPTDAEPTDGEPMDGEPSVADMPDEPEPMPAAPTTGLVEGSVKDATGAAATAGKVLLGRVGRTDTPIEAAIGGDGRFQAPDLEAGTWWFEARVPRHLSERVEVEVRAGEATPLVLDVTMGSYISITDYPFASRTGDVEIVVMSEGHSPISFVWTAPAEAKSPPFGPVWPGPNEIVVTSGGATQRMTGSLNAGRRVLLSWKSNRWR